MVLNKYLYRTVIRPLMVGIAACSFLMLIDSLAEMIESVIVRGVTFWILLELLSYQAINILILTVPMGVMIGAVLSYGSMSENNEFAALNSLGINLNKALKPILLIGGFLSLVLLGVNQFISPASARRQSDIAKLLAFDYPSLGLGANRFIDSIPGYSIYLESFDSRDAASGKFLLFVMEQGLRFPSLVRGERSIWQDGMMIMQNSTAHQINKNGTIDSLARFGEQVIPIKHKVSDYSLYNMENQENQMSLTKLIRTIYERSKKGLYTLRYERAFHLRTALSISPIIMALLGALLAVSIHKRFRRGDGKVSGIAILFIYWIWIMIAKAIMDKFGAFMMWLPNMAFLIIAILIYIRKRRV